METKRDLDNNPLAGEKEIRWEETRRNMEAYPSIEENIREVVVALNAFGFNTENSCEGHYNHGRIVPWVSFSIPGEPKEHYIGQREYEEKIYEENGIGRKLLEKINAYLVARGKKFDELKPEGSAELGEVDEDIIKKRDKMTEELMERYEISPEIVDKYFEITIGMIRKDTIAGAAREGILKNKTPEYVKWEEEMEGLLNKIEKLLEEFYKTEGEPNQKNAKLVLHRGYIGYNLLLRNDGGGDHVEIDKRMSEDELKRYDDILEGRLDSREQEKLQKRIEEYRDEFKRFAEFLKRKFLSGEI